MPGAGAGQEIAKRLNGLKRMLCPPPRGFGQGLSTHPSLPCTSRQGPSSRLTPHCPPQFCWAWEVLAGEGPGNREAQPEGQGKKEGLPSLWGWELGLSLVAQE